jgi:hypothetical protein
LVFVLCPNIRPRGTCKGFIIVLGRSPLPSGEGIIDAKIAGVLLKDRPSMQTKARAIPITLPKVTLRDQASWAAEVGIHPRFSAAPEKEIVELLREAREPKIVLRNTRKGPEIAVQFRTKREPVPAPILRLVAKNAVTLSTAFDIVLAQTIGNKNTLRAVISSAACEAFQDTWLRFLDFTYARHSYPGVAAYHADIRQRISAQIKVRRSGRKKELTIERNALKARYLKLLAISTLVHEASVVAITSVKPRQMGQYVKVVRRTTWKSVGSKVPGMHHDWIFGGAAFQRIPGKRRLHLHQPRTWKPHQLALSLLSLERSSDYKTLARKIVPTKSN